MSVAPFHFKLKKVSEGEERLVDAIYAYLPATGLREGFGKGIREVIARHVGEGFSMRLEALKREGYSSFMAKLPHQSVMAVIGAAPLSNKVILEIDAPLAMMVVERLLGGQAESMPEPRALSDTEQGVLQYLLLQILSHIHRICGKDARAHFRFEKFAFQPHEVQDLSDQNDSVAILIFRIEIGRHSGFVRLSLPDPFVEEGILNVEAPDEIRPAERAWQKKQIERFRYIKAPMWAEAGRATLVPADLLGLEEGDVILLDSGSVKAAGTELEGRAVIRVGSGMHGGIDADVKTEKDHARCTIVGFHKGE